jgi:transposase-like protein
LNITVSEVKCKYCNSRNVIKYGRFKNIQRWWCKDCQRKFAGNNALPGMKVAVNQIGPAVGAYFDGLTLMGITREIVKKYGLYVSNSTIFEWVDRFAQMGTNDSRSYNPRVGNIWIASEAKVRIVNTDYWCIDFIDFTTKFLIATVIFDNFSDSAISKLIESARDRVGKMPKNIIVLGDSLLCNVIYLRCCSYNKNIQITFLEAEHYSEFTSIFKGPFAIRNKVLAKLKKKEHVKTIMDGWVVHYNYRRVHESLDGKTPAEKAGIYINQES